MNWVSNAPVQVNVGRDLHIHCGTTSTVIDTPDDCVLPPRTAGSGFVAAGRRLWSVAKLFAVAAWFLAKVIFWIVVAGLVGGVVLPAAALALSLWILARVADLLLWVERSLGGGPTQLAYLPTLASHRVSLMGEGGELDSVEMRQLAPGTARIRRTQQCSHVGVQSARCTGA